MNASVKRILLSALLLTPLGALHAAPSAKPNVLIILVDDMGWGDPQCFNPQSKIATPHIDRLAAEGMKFTNAHAAASICVPSRYSLLTGRMPYRNWTQAALVRTKTADLSALEKKHFPQPQLQHEPGRLNLATLVKRQGYATACVGKWHQGMSTTVQSDGTLKLTPLNFGFDYYFGFDAPEQGPYAWIENKRFIVAPTETVEENPGVDVTNPKTQGAHWRKGLAAPGWKFEGYLSTLADKADAWLAKQSARGDQKPFFLYYAIPGPHAPWATASEFKGKSGAGQYGDFVINVDAMIGRVLATLDTLKLKENTLVVFSSDNGGERYSRNAPLFHHKATVWEGGIRVPCVMRWPAKLPKGKVTSQMAITMDLHATFLAAAAAKSPPEKPLDGINLVPLLLSDANPLERTFFWRIDRSNRKQRAVREGQWKYLNDGNTMDLLFDLAADIGERTNLNFRHPEITARLKQKLAAWEAEMDASDREILVR
jgi:arylsulfatase A-like enzyme